MNRRGCQSNSLLHITPEGTPNAMIDSPVPPHTVDHSRRIPGREAVSTTELFCAGRSHGAQRPLTVATAAAAVALNAALALTRLGSPGS